MTEPELLQVIEAAVLIEKKPVSVKWLTLHSKCHVTQVESCLGKFAKANSDKVITFFAVFGKVADENLTRWKIALEEESKLEEAKESFSTITGTKIHTIIPAAEEIKIEAVHEQIAELNYQELVKSMKENLKTAGKLPIDTSLTLIKSSGNAKRKVKKDPLPKSLIIDPTKVKKKKQQHTAKKVFPVKKQTKEEMRESRKKFGKVKDIAKVEEDKKKAVEAKIEEEKQKKEEEKKQAAQERKEKRERKKNPLMAAFKNAKKKQKKQDAKPKKVFGSSAKQVKLKMGSKEKSKQEQPKPKPKPTFEKKNPKPIFEKKKPKKLFVTYDDEESSDEEENVDEELQMGQNAFSSDEEALAELEADMQINSSRKRKRAAIMDDDSDEEDGPPKKLSKRAQQKLEKERAEAKQKLSAAASFHKLSQAKPVKKQEMKVVWGMDEDGFRVKKLVPKDGTEEDTKSEEVETKPKIKKVEKKVQPVKRKPALDPKKKIAPIKTKKKQGSIMNFFKKRS